MNIGRKLQKIDFCLFFGSWGGRGCSVVGLMEGKIGSKNNEKLNFFKGLLRKGYGMFQALKILKM